MLTRIRMSGIAQQKKCIFFSLAVLVAAITSAAAPIHDAAQSGDLEQLKSLLAADASLMNTTGPMGTPLHHALFGHQLEAVQYLIANGADVNAAQQGSGFTPLHVSVYAPEQTFAELLIKHDADVNARGVRGFAPLDLAILFGKDPLAVLFIKHGADVAVINGQGRLPLCQAAELGRVGVVEQLLKAGAKTDISDQQNTIPILLAVGHGRLEIVELLLAHGARLDVTDPASGRTALHLAGLAGHAEIVDRLLTAGAAADLTDTAGKTALDYAARYGHRQVAEHLLSHGAKRPLGMVETFGPPPSLTYEPAPEQAVVWYLNHRGWAVKTRDHLVVFDAEEYGVTRPTEPSLVNGFLTPEELRDQNLLGLYTCYHGDPGELAYVHTLADKVAGAAYVHLVADRFRGGERCIYMEPGQQMEIAGATVQTIAADSGNATHAYLVETGDLALFYLGFNVTDPDQFTGDIDALAKTVAGVDIAFLPIPSPEADDGVLDHILEKLRPGAICLLDPNRQEQRYPEVAKALAAAGYNGQVFCAQNPGDSFEYPGR